MRDDLKLSAGLNGMCVYFLYLSFFCTLTVLVEMTISLRVFG